MNEIVLIRLILIILLVVYHSFIIYGGGWRQPQGYENVCVYSWIAKFSYSFFLEAFVAVSGYIFSYQIYTKKKEQTFGQFAINKIKRLLVPCWLFSILYYILFLTKNQSHGIEIAYNILIGTGHLWFLPMLFWCFIFGWFLIRWKVSTKWKICSLLMVSLLSIIPFPLRLNSAFSYMLFFYIGVWAQQYFTRKQIVASFKHLIVIWLLFVALFIVSQFIKEHISNLSESIIEKLFKLEIFKILKILYAMLGMWALYISCLVYVKKNKLSEKLITISSYCFGVYIFQQFILQFLYYKTSLPVDVGPYWLPWIAFVITLLVSLFLSQIFFRTKFGRCLIG